MAFTNGAWPPFVYTHDVPLGSGGPFRADVNSLGGDDFVDDDPQPEIGAEPTASVTNEQNRHIAAHERLSPLARLWVQFSGSTPNIIYVTALGTLVIISSFTVNHPSTGTVDILWPNGTMASIAADPCCDSTQSNRHPTGKIHPSPPSGFSGIRVTITDLAAAAADGDFIAEVY